MAARNDVRALRMSDQLVTEKGGDELMWRFIEKEIDFLPTFKYDKNSEVYDTSKKQRTPSYTDRILFSINEGVQVQNFRTPPPDQERPNGNKVIIEYYHRRESLYSDHRPVLGIFKVNVRKVNEVNLASLKHQILAELKKQKPVPVQQMQQHQHHQQQQNRTAAKAVMRQSTQLNTAP